MKGGGAYASRRSPYLRILPIVVQNVRQLTIQQMELRFNSLQMAKPTILIVGTLDTKLEENLFLREQILDSGTCFVEVRLFVEFSIISILYRSLKASSDLQETFARVVDTMASPNPMCRKRPPSCVDELTTHLGPRRGQSSHQRSRTLRRRRTHLTQTWKRFLNHAAWGVHQRDDQNMHPHRARLSHLISNTRNSLSSGHQRVLASHSTYAELLSDRISEAAGIDRGQWGH